MFFYLSVRPTFRPLPNLCQFAAKSVHYRQACVAQPCRYCFYSVVEKQVSRPAGATRCSDKRLSGQKYGNTAPKTVKMSNFGHKFVPQGSLVCTIFTKFSDFIRIYSFNLVAFGGQTTKLLAFSRGGGIFPQIFNSP